MKEIKSVYEFEEGDYILEKMLFGVFRFLEVVTYKDDYDKIMVRGYVISGKGGEGKIPTEIKVKNKYIKSLDFHKFNLFLKYEKDRWIKYFLLTKEEARQIKDRIMLERL